MKQYMISLKYVPIQLGSLYLRVCTDASFGTNWNLCSQLGYIILLCDQYNACYVIDYASKKSKRIVLSILLGEIYAFTDCFDAGFIVKHDISPNI